MRLDEADHAAVTAAVAAAERGTSGEIVTVVAPRSDSYSDIALLWSTAAAFLALAVIAAFPGFFVDLLDRLRGGWGHAPSVRILMTLLVLAVAAKFAVAWTLLSWMPLRIALTPGAVRSRRARARALDLFRVGAEKRTAGRTGVLLYLSLGEHRAEIVTDAAIHGKVRPEVWGEAMAALIDAVREGRPGAGLAAAVGRIGAVLAEHFPSVPGDTNELPDRLIEL
jgi:putative membrane protein